MASESDMVRIVIVATFDNWKTAYQAADAIVDRTKHRADGLTVTAGTLLGKDETGEISVLGEKDRALFHGVVGALAGALLGLAGGPFGAAIGGAGAVAGIAADSKRVDADEAFVSAVIEAMEPRSAAIVLETDEAGARQIEDIVTRHHGRVVRAGAPS
jgi:uncharacterized membrane protein